MKTKKLENVKGVLLDMDGVVHVGDSVVAGAAAALEFLDARAIPFRFLTNTTTRGREDLCAMLVKMGLRVTIDEVFTTHQVAANYLRKMSNPSCLLLIREELMQVYKGVPLSESLPEYIVIGDIGDRWNYTIMNELFNLVLNGSQIIALHRGRYWQAENGLRLDIGAFISGIEYATGKESIVIGKPSRTFFEMGLSDLGLKANEVIMIGDDIDADIGGAQQASMRGILVQTGKHRSDMVESAKTQPDMVIRSIADLPDLIA